MVKTLENVRNHIRNKLSTAVFQATMNLSLIDVLCIFGLCITNCTLWEEFCLAQLF